VLQVLSDQQMASPDTLSMVLVILEEAFSCVNRCIVATGDEQPRVTLLLLDHLYDRSTGKSRSDIDEARRFIKKQIVDARSTKQNGT
jgi:hypothetical protein